MKNNNKGFTLMEMLIVVAIIAVLIAIAIPTFTGSLEKAREATDLANLRSAYATITSDAMLETSATDFAAKSTDTITYAKTEGSSAYTATVKASQQKSGWEGNATYQIGGKGVSGTIVKGASWVISYDPSATDPFTFTTGGATSSETPVVNVD